MEYDEIQAGFHADNHAFSQNANFLRVSDSVDLLSASELPSWTRPGRPLLSSVSSQLFARTPAAPQSAKFVAHAGKGGDAAKNHRTINRHPRPQPRQLPSHYFSLRRPQATLCGNRKSSPSQRLTTPCDSPLRLIAHGLFGPLAAAAPSSRLNSRQCSRLPQRVCQPPLHSADGELTEKPSHLGVFASAFLDKVGTTRCLEASRSSGEWCESGSGLSVGTE